MEKRERKKRIKRKEWGGRKRRRVRKDVVGRRFALLSVRTKDVYVILPTHGGRQEEISRALSCATFLGWTFVNWRMSDLWSFACWLARRTGRSPPLSFVASAAENLFLMVYFANAKTKFKFYNSLNNKID